MSSRTRVKSLTCTACKAAADVPADRDHRGLWDSGWRWIGSQGLFSCPNCPPVIVVDSEGRHRLPSASTQA